MQKREARAVCLQEITGSAPFAVEPPHNDHLFWEPMWGPWSRFIYIVAFVTFLMWGAFPHPSFGTAGRTLTVKSTSGHFCQRGQVTQSGFPMVPC